MPKGTEYTSTTRLRFRFYIPLFIVIDIDIAIIMMMFIHRPLNITITITIKIIMIINLKLDLISKLKGLMLLYLFVISWRFIPVTILPLFLFCVIVIVHFVRSLSLCDLQSPIAHKFIPYPRSHTACKRTRLPSIFLSRNVECGHVEAIVDCSVVLLIWVKHNIDGSSQFTIRCLPTEFRVQIMGGK